MEEILHILWHTLLDAAKMLPFLLAAYWLIELIEHRSGDKLQASLRRWGKWGPIGGALLGCVPQCGFSVVASNFYAGRLITMGTLVAVFVSTSDEALPLLLATPDRWSSVLPLLGIKVLIAIIAGFIIDRLPFAKRASERHTHDGHHPLHEHCGDVSTGGQVFFSALKHTLTVFAFVFLVMTLLDLAVHWIGEEQFSTILAESRLLQPILAAFLGLIPNCAPSVILTELYASGSISFGAMIAGLCTSAGMGLLVLFRSNRPMKENLIIVACLLAVGLIIGTALHVLFG